MPSSSAPALDPAAVLQASSSLLAHIKQGAPDALFEDATGVHLEIRLFTMPGRARSKPIAM